MSDCTRKLLRPFHTTLRDKVKAVEIYRSIGGLSPFDIDEIGAEKINMVAVDKLVDAVCRRSVQTFVNFVEALRKHHNEEIADKIVSEAERNYKNIHRVLVLPTATVPPSKQEIEGAEAVNSRQETDGTGTANTFRQETRGTATVLSSRQESREHSSLNYVPNIPVTGSEDRSITVNIGNGSRAEQNNGTNLSSQNHEELTLDSELGMADYSDVEVWIEELKRNDNWKQYAKKNLKYKEVKSLEKAENPEDKLFEEHLSALTVRQSVVNLEKANLHNIARMIESKITQQDSPGAADTTTQQNSPPDNDHQTTEPQEQGEKNDLNRSQGSEFESITNNEEVQGNPKEEAKCSGASRRQIVSLKNSLRELANRKFVTTIFLRTNENYL